MRLEGAREFKMSKRVKVSEAAKLLGCSQMAVRCGLRSGKLPIGYAEKTKAGNKKYFYYISRKLLEEYIGKEMV